MFQVALSCLKLFLVALGCYNCARTSLVVSRCSAMFSLFSAVLSFFQIVFFVFGFLGCKNELGFFDGLVRFCTKKIVFGVLAVLVCPVLLQVVSTCFSVRSGVQVHSSLFWLFKLFLVIVCCFNWIPLVLRLGCSTLLQYVFFLGFHCCSVAPYCLGLLGIVLGWCGLLGQFCDLFSNVVLMWKCLFLACFRRLKVVWVFFCGLVQVVLCCFMSIFGRSTLFRLHEVVLGRSGVWKFVLIFVFEWFYVAPSSTETDKFTIQFKTEVTHVALLMKNTYSSVPKKDINSWRKSGATSFWYCVSTHLSVYGYWSHDLLDIFERDLHSFNRFFLLRSRPPHPSP